MSTSPARTSKRQLRAGYAAMAADEAREREAEAWCEALLADVENEPVRSRE